MLLIVDSLFSQLTSHVLVGAAVTAVEKAVDFSTIITGEMVVIGVLGMRWWQG